MKEHLTPSGDTELQILAEHYKNTYDILFLKIKHRDIAFLFALIILIIILFQLYTPQEAAQALSQLISKRIGVETNLSFSFIESVIWFSLLAVILKYYQSVVYIERQYHHIHRLEENLRKYYEDGTFTREGLSYLKDYPRFLNWVSFLYTILFPFLLTAITSWKIVSDFRTMGIKSLLFWFNGLIFILIVISTVLYLITLHGKNKEGRT